MKKSLEKPVAMYSTWFSLKKCLSLINKFRPSYIWMQLVFALFNALYTYFTVHTIAVLLDSVISGEIGSLRDPLLHKLIGSYFFILVLERVISHLMRIQNFDFERFFALYLRNMIINKRVSLELAQLDDPYISNVSMKANESVDRITKYTDNLVNLIGHLYQVIIAAIVVAPYFLVLVLINIATAIPEYFISKKFTLDKYNIYNSTTYMRRWVNDYRSFLYRTREVREVKLSNTGSTLLEKATSISQSINNRYFQLDKNRSIKYMFANLFIMAVATISILYLVNSLILNVVSIGIFTLLISQLTTMRVNSIRSLFFINVIQTESFYLQDVFQFMEIQNSLQDGNSSLPATIESIIIDNISFSYPGSDSQVLHNVSIKIPGGSKIAIVGENGAGKSTFTKLLLRFYDPDQGQVLINGVSLSEFKRADWYERIAYMPQDYNKYPFVLREVVTLGESPEQFDQARYDRALRISQVDRLIATLPLGDQTILSPQYDGGIELSVGQAQKIAIARTLYRRAQVCILDEPTSAIDAISELQIFNAIEELPDDMTIFLISHRFNTVKNADIIIVLEHGTIVESGTHEQLMAHRGRYCEMYTAQKDSYE